MSAINSKIQKKKYINRKKAGNGFQHEKCSFTSQSHTCADVENQKCQQQQQRSKCSDAAKLFYYNRCKIGKNGELTSFPASHSRRQKRRVDRCEARRGKWWAVGTSVGGQDTASPVGSEFLTQKMAVPGLRACRNAEPPRWRVTVTSLGQHARILTFALARMHRCTQHTRSHDSHNFPV